LELKSINPAGVVVGLALAVSLSAFTSGANAATLTLAGSGSQGTITYAGTGTGITVYKLPKKVFKTNGAHGYRSLALGEVEITMAATSKSSRTIASCAIKPRRSGI